MSGSGSGGGFGGLPYGGGPYGGGSSVPAFQNLGFEIPGARAGFAAGWTFSQQSSAFEIGGYYAAQNLILWSEDFARGPWVTLHTSIDSGAALAWDGHAPADALVDTAANTFHFLMQATLADNGPLEFSVEAKAGSVGWVLLSHPAGTVWFDLENGVVGTVGGTAVASMLRLGTDGWWKCSISITAVDDGRYAIGAATSDGSGAYAGAGVAALYLARASIRDGAALAAGVGYTKTTDTPVDLTLPWDNFEQLWANNSANGNYTFAFGVGQTEVGLYDTANTGKPAEDFETGWTPPAPYLLFLDGNTVAGIYLAGDLDPAAFEAFEGGWTAGYFTGFEPGDTEAGLYNAPFSSEPFEGFDLEGSWFIPGPISVYLHDFYGPAIEAGEYGAGGTTQAFEDFEAVFPGPTYHGPIIVIANDTTDVVNLGAVTNLSSETPLLLSTTGTLPAPLEVGTTYWPVSVSGGTCKLSLSHGGSPIDITDTGDGTCTAVGDPAFVWQNPIEHW